MTPETERAVERLRAYFMQRAFTTSLGSTACHVRVYGNPPDGVSLRDLYDADVFTILSALPPALDREAVRRLVRLAISDGAGFITVRQAYGVRLDPDELAEDFDIASGEYADQIIALSQGRLGSSVVPSPASDSGPST